MAQAVAEAVVALDLAELVALAAVAAPVVLLLQLPARLLREAQLLRPVALVAVVAVALLSVQGLVASESLGSR